MPAGRPFSRRRNLEPHLLAGQGLLGAHDPLGDLGSAARNPRAISSVVRPPSRRRVRAIRASVDSTGWQEMNISRSRSSPSSSSASRTASNSLGELPPASTSRPSRLSFSRSRSFRRIRSTARCLAVTMSQAPGLGGMPSAGHCSSAETRASWASSSARPTSRTSRVRPAMIRADSIRHTASIVRRAARVPGVATPRDRTPDECHPRRHPPSSRTDGPAPGPRRETGPRATRS